MPGGTKLERRNSYKEAFLTNLCHSVALPTTDWPTVRLWTKSSLDRLFKKVRDGIGESKPPLTNVELLAWIEKVGLARAFEADTQTFYLLEMGAGPDSEIDPLELMMAYEPSGVVCYFSSLAYHSLTSQMPSHHHVAVLTEPSRLDRQQDVRSEDVEEGLDRRTTERKTAADGKPRIKASPFGKTIFSYSGISYYLTRRTSRLVPGVQTRSEGPRARFRITTCEQSLLDTLHRPQNCGGPAVVLEAWHEATTSERLDEERLMDYLVRMDYPSTSRRVGAMLRLMDYTPGVPLERYLGQAKQNIDNKAPYSQISLLPGFDYSNLDQEWLVRLP